MSHSFNSSFQMCALLSSCPHLVVAHVAISWVSWWLLCLMPGDVRLVPWMNTLDMCTLRGNEGDAKPRAQSMSLMPLKSVAAWAWTSLKMAKGFCRKELVTLALFFSHLCSLLFSPLHTWGLKNQLFSPGGGFGGDAVLEGCSGQGCPPQLQLLPAEVQEQ